MQCPDPEVRRPTASAATGKSLFIFATDHLMREEIAANVQKSSGDYMYSPVRYTC